MTNGNSAERERFEAVYRKRFPNSSSFQDDLFFTDELGEYQETKVFVAFYMWREALSVRADGGNGDEHDSRMWDAGYSAGIDFERRRSALLADGGKGEAVAWMTDDGRVATDETKTMAMHGSTAKSFHIPLYAAPTPERADAKKDAALTDEQIEAAIEAWFDTDGKDVDDHQSRMRAAILAANKEPERAQESYWQKAAETLERANVELSCAYVELKKKAIQACEEVQRRSGGEKYNMFGKDLAEQCIEAIRRHCKEPK